MTLERFCVKFFAQSNTEIDDGIFIEIFHEWIRLKKLAGILLDVADYRHVPEGPGMMLITHDINFAMDYADGRFGLYAQRKSGPGDTLPAKILELIQATVAFGTLLESDTRVINRLTLNGESFEFLANDRLLAPNSQATFDTLRLDLTAVANILYPDQDVSITRVLNDAADRLTLEVRGVESIDMKMLLNRIAIPA